MSSSPTHTSTVTSADGTRIDFDRQGSGPVVVLICAGPTERSSHAELAALLADTRTVVNYDRRGRGTSGDTQPFHVDREVEDLMAVAEAVTAGDSAGVSLFGNSGGAFIAFRAAAAGMPIHRLTLWEPPFAAGSGGPEVPSDYQLRQAALAQHDRNGDMVELFLGAAVGMPPEVIAGLRQSPYWGFIENAANPALVYDAAQAGDFDVPVERVARVTCPTLVLDGGTTPWLTRAADRVAELIPGGSRRTLAGQPHNVDSGALAPALAEFLVAQNGAGS
ncbi:alpha/beta fold hydrolase [Nocardioides speluncae]|uniref:alpha/beta fold hydrolase n=1 Tax=Nocardioides speluncae TaxID=2670337 RepID=UPI0013796FDC|nr:alpha/beta hydrolase [Nocardioides speluncae]